jgi:hypothetical protein
VFAHLAAVTTHLRKRMPAANAHTATREGRW